MGGLGWRAVRGTLIVTFALRFASVVHLYGTIGAGREPTMDVLWPIGPTIFPPGCLLLEGLFTSHPLLSPPLPRMWLVSSRFPLERRPSELQASGGEKPK